MFARNVVVLPRIFMDRPTRSMVSVETTQFWITDIMA